MEVFVTLKSQFCSSFALLLSMTAHCTKQRCQLRLPECITISYLDRVFMQLKTKIYTVKTVCVIPNRIFKPFFFVFTCSQDSLKIWTCRQNTEERKSRWYNVNSFLQPCNAWTANRSSTFDISTPQPSAFIVRRFHCFGMLHRCDIKFISEGFSFSFFFFFATIFPVVLFKNNPTLHFILFLSLSLSFCSMYSCIFKMDNNYFVDKLHTLFPTFLLRDLLIMPLLLFSEGI